MELCLNILVDANQPMLPSPPPLQIRPDSSNPFMLDALMDGKRAGKISPEIAQKPFKAGKVKYYSG